MATPDLRGLRTLQAIRDTGSLAEAAVHLRLTPSALSHQLRDIETGIGQPVLHRKTRPPRFTPAGERLLALADLVLTASREAGRDLGRMQAHTSGHLVLAIGNTAGADWLMPVLAGFRARWPEVGIDFQEGGGKVDGATLLAIDIAPGPGMKTVPLFEYETVLLVAPGHPLAGRAFVRPRDLADETLLVSRRDEANEDLFRLFLVPAGVRPARVRQAESTAMRVQLAASGRGVTALPAWMAGAYLEQEWVRAVPLGGSGAWCTLYAALREADLAQAWVQDFIDTARAAALATLRGVRPVAADEPG